MQRDHPTCGPPPRACAARLCKQTQFGGFRSDCGCPCEQTKPIPGGWHTPPFYCSIIPPFRPDADRAKQSQFTGRGRAQLYKQTQFPPVGREPRRRNVRNKPNSLQPRGLGWASATLPMGKIAPNKPNSARSARWVPGSGKRAKQTQFAPSGRNRWGEPHPTRAQMCETNPIRPAGRLEATCETNPICARAAIGGAGHHPPP